MFASTTRVPFGPGVVDFTDRNVQPLPEMSPRSRATWSMKSAIASQSTQLGFANRRSSVVVRFLPLKFNVSTQWRTNASADAALVPFASGGRVGAEAEGEAGEGEALEDLSGLGLAGSS